MKLVKGSGKVRVSCRQCDKLISSTAYVYISTEGRYDLACGGVKKLHDGAMKFIKSIAWRYAGNEQ